MKRISTLLAAVALTVTVMAQRTDYRNFVGLNLGGGINTLTYSPKDGDYKIGLGCDAGLHYTHFFGEHFGMGFGAYYGLSNSKVVYNFTETTTGLTHPDNTNAKYDLNTQFNGWRERQNVTRLSIPVEFFWRKPACDTWTFIAGLGASFDLPLSGKLKTDEGTYTTSGYFHSLGYPVTNLPSHGFGTYEANQEKDIENLKLGVSVIADLGFRKALKNRWGLYMGLYCGYGVSSMLDEKGTDPLLLINSADPNQHDYIGTVGSNRIDALHLLRIGIKVGIDLGWNGGEKKAKALAEAEAARLAREKAEAEARAKAEAEARAKADAEAARLAREKAEADARAAKEKAEAEAHAIKEKAEADARAIKAKAEADVRAKAEQEERERAARVQARLDSIAAAQAFMPAKPVSRQEMQKKLDDINATVYFETAGTTPKFDEKTDAIIRTLCASMMADDNLKAEITGHTDNKGTAAVNIKYGQKRADALKKYMVSLGAPAANIETKSRGMEQPIVPNDSDANRAKNRRATVILK